MLRSHSLPVYLALFIAVPWILAQPASAQPAGQGRGPSQASAQSPFEAARDAFEGMPEAQRKSIQDALVWTGDYKGAIDGEFGPGTFKAIQAFRTRLNKSSRGGILSPKDRDVLETIARRGRTGVGFGQISDKRSGITISMPTKFVTGNTNVPGGIRYHMARQQAQLDIFQLSGSQYSLEGYFKTLRKGSRAFKPGYSILRGNFFVVTGQTPGTISYSRVQRGDANGTPVLRGFTLTYNKSQRRVFENLAIAISNSFLPFSVAGRPATGPAQAVNLRPQAQPVEFVAATAVAVAPDTYLTVLPAGGCASARIGKAPATIISSDSASGISVLRAPVGGGRPINIQFQATSPGQAAFGLFAVPQGPIDAPVISLARGRLTGASGKLRLDIAMPAGASGALVASANGALAGLTGRGGLAHRKLAGAVPPAFWSILAPAIILAVLKAANVPNGGVASAAPAEGAQSPAAVAGRYAHALAPLWCQMAEK